ILKNFIFFLSLSSSFPPVTSLICDFCFLLHFHCFHCYYVGSILRWLVRKEEYGSWLILSQETLGFKLVSFSFWYCFHCHLVASVWYCLCAL
ncbi:hypothetical protein VIGAN_06055000, partial [Vigna angularis var. angularis]